MSDTIEDKDVIKMMLGAVERIRENHGILSKLDAATGDGDHGTTMLRSVKAVEDVVNANPDENLKTILYEMGWGIMSADGGSTGPLLGSFFMGMSEQVDGLAIFDAQAVAAMIIAGAEKMHKQSRANVGDKTMMDAMLPAIDVLKTSDQQASVQGMLQTAAKAANEGSEATKSMKAKFGRARNLGDRVLGHQDPGSLSIALMFQGFYEGLAN
jgi:phosphoenolpyruvate---glycerone phosphotransferase subunit DhaL